jgi:hypothetical protein
MHSIVFMIAGDLEYALDKPETFIQLSERDALDLFAWLGLEQTDFGVLEASDLAARCRRRSWPMPRNVDPAVAAHQERSGGSNVSYVVPARQSGYLLGKTQQLLKLAERAGVDGKILFS